MGFGYSEGLLHAAESSFLAHSPEYGMKSRIKRARGSRLKRYSAPPAGYSAPAIFRARVLGFEGLEDRCLLSINPVAQPFAVALPNPVASPLAGSANPQGFSPTQIRHAYGVDQITFSGGSVVGDGAGQTVAIVTAY